MKSSMVQQNLLQRIVDAMVILEARWGRSSIALLATDAFRTGNPFISAASLAARTSISDDTARRRLDSLTRRGLLVAEGSKARKVYRTTEKEADYILSLVAWVNDPSTATCGQMPLPTP
jgi:DNA-binding GntR family transcriptional regulator